MKTMSVLFVVLVLAVPHLSFAADGEPAGGNTDAATTVKSSKSNSSERLKDGAADAAKSVKGSKSNSSERVKDSSAESSTTVKSGKSNSSD